MTPLRIVIGRWAVLGVVACTAVLEEHPVTRVLCAGSLAAYRVVTDR
jgi:hypothetical protein